MVGRPANPGRVRDYFGIRRDYSVEEFMNDVRPQGVTKSVHVTAMWGQDRALDETRQSAADKHGFPHSIVCNADLSDPGADAALMTQKQFPNLRGVRQMLYWYAVELIKTFPNVRMILVHAGMLTVHTQAAIEQWRAALTMMAAFPNLHEKISGLGMYSSGKVIRDDAPRRRGIS
jgi:predicted TIM-barrel fold metal-dependent hydrolase